MRDPVDLGEARNLHIPVIRLEGDVMLQQGPGLGAAIEPAPQPPLVGTQPVIDGASADREQLILGLWGEAEAPVDPGHPLGQQRFQSRRPRIVGGLPDCLHNRNHPRTVGRRPVSPLRPSLLSRRWTIQQANRVLAVVSAVGAKLVQDALLGRRVRLLVPRVNSLQILPFRSLTHEVTRLHGG